MSGLPPCPLWLMEKEMALKISVGDILELKKPHPCGGKTFEVMRAGMDFRLKCQTCETQVWLTRPNLEKRVRKITPAADKKDLSKSD